MKEVQATRNGVTQTTRYSYDAFSRRLAKHGLFGSTWFTWDGNRLLQEQHGSRLRTFIYEPDSFVPLAQVESSAAPVLGPPKPPPEDDPCPPRKKTSAELARDYYYGIKQPPAPGEVVSTEELIALAQPDFMRAPARVLYYHCDHLGTPQELTNAKGDLIWQAEYLAWGNTVRVAYPEWEKQAQNKLGKAKPQVPSLDERDTEHLPSHQPLRFQGQYFDAESGLHYNRFRYYDPDSGRFVSHDPIGLGGGANTYRYVSSPLGWIDPFGLSCASSLIRYKPRDELTAQPGTRQDAIDRAWALEKELLQAGGAGTRPWSAVEIETILNTPTGNKPGQLSSVMSNMGYTGHHINSVKNNGALGQKWQADPRNIVFLENHKHPNSTNMPNAYNEHFHSPQGRRGSTTNTSRGRLIDRQAMIDQAKKGCRT